MTVATSTTAPPNAVHADIDFLVPRPGRTFSYGYEPTADEPPASTEFAAQRVLIRDIRASTPLSLDTNGAALLQRPTVVRDFYDDDQLSGHYYAEAAEIIKAALGASRIVVFDHNVRRGSSLALKPERYDQGRPVHHAHTDYTELSAARRLGDLFGGEARELVRHRYVQVNLWRPIAAPLRDAPLAICDGATVAPHSLRRCELLYPGRHGEIYYLVHEADQYWYYASDMAVDEVWIFKNFDSAPVSAVHTAPHSAFEDPRRYLHVLPRESIEVRAFAFFDA